MVQTFNPRGGQLCNFAKLIKKLTYIEGGLNSRVKKDAAILMKTRTTAHGSEETDK